MDGKLYRLREFMRSDDNRALIVDASASLSLGVVPGLEDFEQAVRPVLSHIDGLVCSPGQIRRLQNRTRTEAGVLVRMDWNNTLRGVNFVFPPATPYRIPIMNAQDALDLGAVAMVSTFMVGFPEDIEAELMRSTVQLAMEGKDIGLPLVVEVQANGPRVSLPDKAIELGASYALEGGADVIAIPYPGQKSLGVIASFVSVPWLVKAASLEEASRRIDEVLTAGGAGIWLDYHLFAQTNPASAVAPIQVQLHQPLAA